MLIMGYANIPREDKVSDGGDDAWFVTNSIVNAMGVADGVGSWRRMGINAGNCARCVMRVAKDYFINGREVVSESLEEANTSCREQGSTTALVAYLDDAQMLNISQIGDSNLIVIRDGQVKFQTSSGTHSRNVPFSMGLGSKDKFNKVLTDYTFYCKSGDIIIMGTDGLWDNLYPVQVIDILKTTNLKSPTRMAKVLCNIAYNMSEDEEIWSPFAQDAYEAGDIYDTLDLSIWEGGKPDDITIVVAIVE
ncbi:MAG: PP2C family serine/threonine-protein phosphatase [Candidatus Thorarchaeota archaeon]